MCLGLASAVGCNAYCLKFRVVGCKLHVRVELFRVKGGSGYVMFGSLAFFGFRAVRVLRSEFGVF